MNERAHTVAGVTKVAEVNLRIAMFSVHSSPLGSLGSQDTGGMSVYVRELAREVGARGCSVDIFTRDVWSTVPPVMHLYPNVRLVHLRSGAGRDVRKLALYPYLPEFLKSLEEFERVDGAGYNLVHSHYWISAELGQWAAERWGIPHVVTYHTLGAVKNQLARGESEPPLRLLKERETAHAADRVIVATDRERGNLIGLYGVPAEAVGVVPCGVDLERFRPIDRTEARRTLGMPTGGESLLYVGRFDPLKGLDRLIEALAELRRNQGRTPTLLVIGGDGSSSPSTRALRRRIATLGLEGSVRLLGRVEHDRLTHYYSAANLLVVPSYYESFGLVTLEALACGVPVVTTDVGVAEPLFATRQDGLLVVEGSALGLAEGICSLLDAAPPRPEGVRTGVLGYGWPQVAAQILQEYGVAGFEQHARWACATGQCAALF